MLVVQSSTCSFDTAPSISVPPTGWYSRTTDPKTGETSIRVGPKFFPIVRLQLEGDRSNGNGEQRSSNSSSNGDGESSSGPGGLQSLRVGPFGNLVSIDDGENQNPDIGVLGGGGG